MSRFTHDEDFREGVISLVDVGRISKLVCPRPSKSDDLQPPLPPMFAIPPPSNI